MTTLGRFLGLMTRFIGAEMRMLGPFSSYSDYGPRTTVYATDYSGSMANSDIKPNRYVAACNAVHRHVEARKRLNRADWAAAVVFNESARIVCRGTPMERANAAIIHELRRLEPDGGTSFSAGLSAVANLFASAPSGHCRHLIMLSDGHDNERGAHVIAGELKRRGVLIDCIGVGSTPSEVDEDYLKAIASTADGRVRYVFINNADDLNDHFEAIATGMRRQV